MLAQAMVPQPHGNPPPQFQGNSPQQYGAIMPPRQVAPIGAAKPKSRAPLFAIAGVVVVGAIIAIVVLATGGGDKAAGSGKGGDGKGAHGWLRRVRCQHGVRADWHSRFGV